MCGPALLYEIINEVQNNLIVFNNKFQKLLSKHWAQFWIANVTCVTVTVLLQKNLVTKTIKHSSITGFVQLYFQ